jgi:SdpC family antimicrobial peptide
MNRHETNQEEHKTMKTKTITAKLSAALLSLAIPACDLENRGSDPTDQLELQEREGRIYSGEELFLGIFFGHGEAAEHLPLMWGDCGRDTRNRVIADMRPEVLLEEIERLQQDPANEVLSPQLAGARELIESGQLPHSDERMYELVLELVRQQDPEYFERFAEVVYSGDRIEILDAIKRGREIIRDIILVNQNPFDPGEGQGIVEVLVVFVAIAVVAYVWLEIEVVGVELDQSRIYEEIMVEEIASQFAIHY